MAHFFCKNSDMYVWYKWAKLWSTKITLVITNSDLNRPCFAWNPYGKSGLFKTE